MKRTASKVINDVAVYYGRQLLGHVLETHDGSHQAVTADGEVLGTYQKRQDASRAVGEPPK